MKIKKVIHCRFYWSTINSLSFSARKYLPISETRSKRLSLCALTTQKMNDTRETFVEEIVDNVTDYGSYDEQYTNTDQTYLPPNENTSNLRPYGFELFIVEGICLNSVGKYICGQKILKPLFIGTNSQRNWIKRALNPY